MLEKRYGKYIWLHKLSRDYLMFLWCNRVIITVNTLKSKLTFESIRLKKNTLAELKNSQKCCLAHNQIDETLVIVLHQPKLNKFYDG